MGTVKQEYLMGVYSKCTNKNGKPKQGQLKWAPGFLMKYAPKNGCERNALEQITRRDHETNFASSFTSTFKHKKDEFWEMKPRDLHMQLSQMKRLACAIANVMLSVIKGLRNLSKDNFKVEKASTITQGVY